jgi:riboflavin biosynthesis pyrimidine reductase
MAYPPSSWLCTRLAGWVRRGLASPSERGAGRIPAQGGCAPLARPAEKQVLVHGAYTAQRALEAGVLDELQIHQIPVLFGRGRRLFDDLPSRIELEVVRVIDTPEAIHIRYRVLR